MKKETFSLDAVYSAYLDCRRRKRNTKACAEFELNEVENIYSLYKDLNNGTYTIGKSIAFCVTRPKIREVFAASFRDRIVHHLLILRYGDLLENYFISDTYNCRKGKGTMYGHNRALDLSKEYSDGWVLSFDISDFFMSIDKTILANRIEIFLRERYKWEDIEEVMALTRQVILHNPELNCERRGDLKLWNKLPKEKSLFHSKMNKGLAIGNLTSQIYANFYMADFDKFMMSKLGSGYQRYVDDGRGYSHNRDALLYLIPVIRKYLKEQLALKLHPNKIEFQQVRKGFKFIGASIKKKRLYIGNRTVGNFYNMVIKYNKNPEKSFMKDMEGFVCRYNSYSGFLAWKRTYKIRCKIWNNVSEYIKDYVYIRNNKSSIVLKKEYRVLTKYKKRKNDLQHIYKRRFQRNRTI